MKKLVVILIAFLAIGCSTRGIDRDITTPTPLGSTTTATQQPDLPTWACGGQSNAVPMCTYYLKPYASLVGSWESGMPISSWDENMRLWNDLRDSIQATPVSAFVWWQGETDAITMAPGEYLGHLRDLVARVRAAAGQPDLTVVIIEIGPAYDGLPVKDDQREFVRTDPHAIYIATDDIPFNTDGVHMLPPGYQAVAERINSRLKPKR